MNFITRAEARQNIIELGLPEVVLDVFDEKALPYNLDLTFRYPYTVFCLDAAQQARYGIGKITPIWTDSSAYTVVAYDHAPERSGFFRFDIETAEIEHPAGLNWQQALVRPLQSLWEDEMPDDRLREVADWFGFRHAETFLHELAQTKLDTAAKDAAWYESFIARLGE
jgi:hypothetical protein